MDRVATIAFFLGVISYSAAATLFFVDLARREGSLAASRWAPVALAAGALMHGAHVIAASVWSRVSPVESLHFALSLSALLATTVFLLVRRRLRLNAIGAFIAPVALTFLVGAEFVGLPDLSPTVPKGLLALHITANLAGLGLFLLAGAAGVFYLVQERRLKAKRAGGLTAKLPPLDALDTTEHRLLLAGFPLLTFGIVTGVIFATDLVSASAAELARTALAFMTWFLVAGVLALRAAVGWRGRRAAYGTIAGVVCVLLVILLYALKPGGVEGL